MDLTRLGPHVPDLAALEMLHVVHHRGSFSAAAKELGLTQQAVSSRIRAMERLIGAELFVRTPAGATLSKTGALVADWADDVLAAAERLEAGISAMRTDTARRMRLAASQTVAEYLLPGWLVTLRRQQQAAGLEPTVVELSVTNSAHAIDLVADGDALVGFIETPRLPRRLAHRQVQSDRLVVVVPPGHRWARRRKALQADELAATPLVTREVGSGTRDTLEHLLREAVPEVPQAPPAVELSTTAAVRSAIAAGTAPGVLSAAAVYDDLMLNRLVVVPLEDLDLVRPLSAIWRSGRTPPTGPARDLIAIAARGSA